MIVNAIGCGFDPHSKKNIYIFISSLWCQGKARRWVPPLNTQCPQNSAENGEMANGESWFYSHTLCPCATTGNYKLDTENNKDIINLFIFRTWRIPQIYLQVKTILGRNWKNYRRRENKEISYANNFSYVTYRVAKINATLCLCL